MSVTTALQNIERAKGAAAERKAIAAIVRNYLRLYKADLILKNLLREIEERGK